MLYAQQDVTGGDDTEPRGGGRRQNVAGDNEWGVKPLWKHERTKDDDAADPH